MNRPGDSRVSRLFLEGDEAAHDLVDAGIGGRADEQAGLRSTGFDHAIVEKGRNDAENLRG